MIKVVVKEPNKAPEVRELEESLDTYQEIVGGYIEVVSITPEILLVCNEEGKFQELPVNFTIGRNHQILDVIVGTAFFVGSGVEDFESLTEEQIQYVMSLFS
jgi:hypothetical protein